MSYAILGVRIFFVISGYLITTLLLQEQAKTGTISLRDFYVRRAYRILPAATAFLIPALIISRHELTWYHAAAAVLYLSDFDPTRPRFLGHLWSLSVEEQFYLLWPSVLKRWYGHRVGILLGVVAIAPLYQLVGYALQLHVAQTFFAVADNLAIGCLLAIFAPRIPQIRKWLGLAMIAPVLLVPLCLAVSRTRTLILLFVLWPLMYVSIAGVLLHVVQTPSRLLNLGPVVWLGKISYSLYLWQQVFVFGPGPRPAYLIIPAVGMACLSYYLVERPMLRLREKRGAKKRGERLLNAREEDAGAAVKIA